MKKVLKVAAGIDEMVRAEHLRIGKETNREESGEEYAEKIIKFLREERGLMHRKEAKEDDRARWKMEAKEFKSVGGRGVTDQGEGEEGINHMKLNPHTGLMVTGERGLRYKEKCKERGEEHTHHRRLKRRRGDSENEYKGRSERR